LHHFSLSGAAISIDAQVWIAHTLTFAALCHSKDLANAAANRKFMNLDAKRNEMPPAGDSATTLVVIDGLEHRAREGERLIDLINRVGVKLAQVCYHPQLGLIQSCDTCMVEIEGKLVNSTCR
jgi:hypothetical protein